jgi:hypothetical protein
MKSTVLWALAVLNVLLLALFISRLTRDNVAQAQLRRPGDYLMVVGDVTTSAAQVVHVIDSTNGLLGAMSYDDAARRLDVMTPIELNRVFEGGVPAPMTPTPAPRRP